MQPLYLHLHLSEKKYMLKLLLFLSFLLPVSVFGQSENSIDKYCELTIKPAYLFSKQKVIVDFGNLRLNEETKLEIDSATKNRSAVQILNYMAKRGWQLVTYSIKQENNTNYYTYTYYLKKTTDATISFNH